MYLGKQNYRMVNMSQQLPHNYISTVDPTIDVNPPIINMTWLNSTSGEVFVCMDNTVGANTWVDNNGIWVGKDKYWDNVELLLDMSTGSVRDLSKNSITNITNTLAVAYDSVSQENHLLMDAANNVIINDAVLALGSGDWCLEFWVDVTGGDTYGRVVAIGETITEGEIHVCRESTNPGYATEIRVSSVWDQLGVDGTAWPVGYWQHYALTHSGTEYNVFSNGIKSSTVINAAYPTQSIMYLGSNSLSTETCSGRLKGIRVTKGVTRYVEDFIPSMNYVKEAPTF